MRTLFAYMFLALFSLSSFAGGLEGKADDYAAGTEFLKEFSVYPNPTTGDITLTIRPTDAAQALTFKVYNLIGQEMHSESIAPFSGSKQLDFDLSKFPKGIYMVEISNGKESRIKRVSLI